MKLSEILKEINVLSAAASGDTEITGVCYDSRRVKNGDLFVAVRGYESDGHKYIPMAVEKGAVVTITAKKPDVETPSWLPLTVWLWPRWLAIFTGTRQSPCSASASPAPTERPPSPCC